VFVGIWEEGRGKYVSETDTATEFCYCSIGIGERRFWCVFISVSDGHGRGTNGTPADTHDIWTRTMAWNRLFRGQPSSAW
jgi:hypothetical protein